MFPFLSSLLVLSFVAGCLGPRREHYQTSERLSVAEASPRADRLWDAIQETLRRHRFELDRVDRRAGVITTMPETSQALFEMWRHDVDTWPDLLESTVNPLRRWVQVTLVPDDDTDETLHVVVHKERLSSPDRQFNSSGAAYQYFAGRLPSTTGAVRVTEKETTWIDIGRDPAMEEHLLHAILTRAGLPIGHERSATQEPDNG